MNSVRVLIAMTNDVTIDKIKTLMHENGFLVVDEAKDGNECLRKMRTLRPDISILDFSLNSISALEVSRVAIEDDISNIIMISTEEQKSLIYDLNSPGFICLSKPLNKNALLSTVEIMARSRKKIKTLEDEIDKLRTTIDTRKEVEKAKGLLMKRLGLTEQEAFKRIQRQSMDKGIPMKEIAKAIILAYDI